MSNEFLLLSTLSKLNISETDISKVYELLSIGIDGKVFLEHLEFAQTWQIVNSNIQKYGLEKQLACYSIINKRANHETLKCMRLTQKIAEIARIFDENNIPMLTVKGPAFAKVVYGNVGLRSSVDLDILVKKEDITKAIDALGQAGLYLEKIYCTPKRKEKLLRWEELHFELINKEHDLFVELHWRLEPYHSLEFDEMWEKKTETILCGEKINVLCPEHMLVGTVLHSIRHGYCYLKHLTDVDAVISKNENLDVSLIYEIIKRENMLWALVVTNNLLNKYGYHYLDLDESENGDKKIEEFCTSFLVQNDRDIREKKHKEYYSIWISKLKLCGKLKGEHMRRFMKHVIPNAYEYNLINVPDYLYWVYYPIRLGYKFFRLCTFRPQI